MATLRACKAFWVTVTGRQQPAVDAAAGDMCLAQELVREVACFEALCSLRRGIPAGFDASGLRAGERQIEEAAGTAVTAAATIARC